MEHSMAKILNKAQAEAARSIIVALNNVGGHIHEVKMEGNIRVMQSPNYIDTLISVARSRKPDIGYDRECYGCQADFFAAYGLEQA